MLPRTWNGAAVLSSAWAAPERTAAEKMLVSTKAKAESMSGDREQAGGSLKILLAFRRLSPRALLRKSWPEVLLLQAGWRLKAPCRGPVPSLMVSLEELKQASLHCLGRKDRPRLLDRNLLPDSNQAHRCVGLHG
jgi:hypothetical protein